MACEQVLHASIAGGRGCRLCDLYFTRWCSMQLSPATCGRLARSLRLRTTTIACRGRLIWPLLHVVAASYLWQTREHPLLDATARATDLEHGLGHQQRGRHCFSMRTRC
ncbi:hypothetical protein B296_00006177 [Ensete ventricosum]|uniref:Uncharacterized protein n=1 Tax=Ensete ventricosum TaxID=4639 RepID=A0A426ZE69_ENSVE|nr:hypothetical protein B296_00006177 [Ensete ventricosum]